MTININLLRAERGADPELVKKSEEKRFRTPENVEMTMEADQLWRRCQFDLEQCQKTKNAVNKKIAAIKKNDPKDPVTELMKEKKETEAEIVRLQELAQTAKDRREVGLNKIGNVVHESVPVSQDEADNEVVREWGTPRVFTTAYNTKGFLPHFELLSRLGAVDLERGRKVAGHRAYFLTGVGLLLNQALIQCALSFLYKKDYIPVQPPFFMNQDVMAKTAELADYNETLYHVTDRKDDNKYLIATSEQPISAMHMNENIEEDKLPIRYAGLSTCFRREAGSHGRDIRGIFRCHQFEKVEQFVICKPEDSWAEHERMIGQCCEFYTALGIPHRVVNLVSSELNDAAAKKFDLEGWFPGDNEGEGLFRELVSCSNCTDYQSRKLKIRQGFANFASPKDNKDLAKTKDTENFVHMLNSTMTATERTLCCLVENYQDEHGVRVPEILQPFMMGMEFLPFKE